MKWLTSGVYRNPNMQVRLISATYLTACRLRLVAANYVRSVSLESVSGSLDVKLSRLTEMTC